MSLSTQKLIFFYDSVPGELNKQAVHRSSNQPFLHYVLIQKHLHFGPAATDACSHCDHPVPPPLSRSSSCADERDIACFE